MGRVYKAGFKAGTIPSSGTLDIWSIFSGSVKAFRLHHIELGQVTASAVNNLQLSMYRITGTIGAGSGGTTPGLVPTGPNDTAATITAHACDTSPTTQSGGATTLFWSTAWNIINGYIDLPPQLDRMEFGPASAFVLRLETFPASSLSASGGITVEELF